VVRFQGFGISAPLLKHTDPVCINCTVPCYDLPLPKECQGRELWLGIRE
jgi:hypothetical protein